MFVMSSKWIAKIMFVFNEFRKLPSSAIGRIAAFFGDTRGIENIFNLQK